MSALPLLLGQDGAGAAAEEALPRAERGEDVSGSAPEGGPDRTVVHIDSLPFVAAAPGVYVLAGDRLLDGAPHAILVASDDVVLDLGGHVLEGGLESGHAILAEESFEGVVIRNGRVRHFARNGVALSLCHGVRMVDVEVSNSGGHGIWLGDDAVVAGCAALFNFGGRGILLGERALVRDTRAQGNVYGGIYAGARSIVERAAVEQSMYGDGIRLGAGSILRASRTERGGAAGARLGADALVDGFESDSDLAVGLVVGPRASVRKAVVRATLDGPGIELGSGSQALDCRVEGVFGEGFLVGDGALVARCHARATAGAGFRIGAGSVLDSAVSEPAGEAAGVLVLGSGNLVRATSARSAAGVDFRVQGEGNVLLGNRARAIGFDVAPGNLAPTREQRGGDAPLPWQNVLE